MRTTLNTIIRTFAQNEAEFIATATAVGLAEGVVEARARARRLEQQPGFEDFFIWLCLHTSGLLRPCLWLVLGPQRIHDATPTFHQIQLLIQLVREHQPKLLAFTRRLIIESLLAKAAESKSDPTPCSSKQAGPSPPSLEAAP